MLALDDNSDAPRALPDQARDSSTAVSLMVGAEQLADDARGCAICLADFVSGLGGTGGTGVMVAACVPCFWEESRAGRMCYF